DLDRSRGVNMPRRQAVVMASSTILDLPEHRKCVLDALDRLHLSPSMMEHLPASSQGKIGESMRLVDEADVYLGIFGHSYGEIPDGHSSSITEMEYDRAVERGIPRLIFIIDPAHWEASWPSDSDPGAAARLQRLKDRIQKDDQNVTRYFSSPEHLRRIRA